MLPTPSPWSAWQDKAPQPCTLQGSCLTVCGQRRHQHLQPQQPLPLLLVAVGQVVARALEHCLRLLLLLLVMMQHHQQ